MERVSEKILQQASFCLCNGELIAYPTEAVYGLGCDPFNADAVATLLIAKHRSIRKGLILIASEWQQIESLVLPISPHILLNIKESWPGPVTWLFPASDQVPEWITGHSDKVAIRITAHPIARAICDSYGGAIVSTSANKSGESPARDARGVELSLGSVVQCVVPGSVGGQRNPTEIRDALTGDTIRAS